MEGKWKSKQYDATIIPFELVIYEIIHQMIDQVISSSYFDHFSLSPIIMHNSELV